MTEKRFTVHKTIGMFHCFYVNDNLTDKVVIDQILHKYESDRLCDLLNSLAEDNKMLNRMIDKRDGWNNLAHEQLFKLGKENEQLKNAIIGKIQYGEDLEKFAIEKGLIQEDWARFDDYD